MKQTYAVTNVSETVFDPLQNATLCLVETENGVTIELVAGPTVASLLDRGVKLYHVAYAVEDIGRSLDHLVRSGAEKVTDPTPAILFGNRLVCFLRTPLGLVELVEGAVAPVGETKRRTRAFAICASFTAAPIEEPLVAWFEQLGWTFEVRLSPPGQVVQTLLDPSSALSENERGINVVLLRTEDVPDEAVDELAQALRRAVGRRPIPHLVCLCPGESPEAGQQLVEKLRSVSGVHLISAAELMETYPVTNWRDPHSDRLAQIPYTPDFFVALATMLARGAYRAVNPPRKVIVLDCDNTLWRGVCGEDGPLGVVLDESSIALQRFMRRQYDSGRLLCLCSKNNEKDVLEVFHAHPEMPLSLDCFVSTRINWARKPENIRAMAEELRLSLDSFVFIDDNPVECAEVASACPEVLTFVLPERPEDVPSYLDHVWALDLLKTTPEDRMRTATYHADRIREQARAEASSFVEFLAGLELEIQFHDLDASHLTRVAQLTQRTTQFNTSARMRSESELQRSLEQGELQGLVAHMRDRFGDYGVVGAVLFRPESSSLTVDTFLLSCRAFGKDLEHHMLARLGETAMQYGLSVLDFVFTPTDRNVVAMTFLESIATSDRDTNAAERRFRVPVDLARKAGENARTKPMQCAAAECR